MEPMTKRSRPERWSVGPTQRTPAHVSHTQSPRAGRGGGRLWARTGGERLGLRHALLGKEELLGRLVQRRHAALLVQDEDAQQPGLAVHQPKWGRHGHAVRERPGASSRRPCTSNGATTYAVPNVVVGVVLGQAEDVRHQHVRALHAGQVLLGGQRDHLELHNVRLRRATRSRRAAPCAKAGSASSHAHPGRQRPHAAAPR